MSDILFFNKGMKLKQYTVVIHDGSGIIGKGRPESKFEVEEFNVIGENSINIVIDDLHFTTLKKAKEKHRSCLDNPTVGFNNQDSCWGNRISYQLFTFSEKSARKIKSEIQKEVDKRFGFFSKGFDLSFINEKEIKKAVAA